jgi:hypothetical protein
MTRLRAAVAKTPGKAVKRAKPAPAGVPVDLPPRSPEEEALVAEWKSRAGLPGRLARPPKFEVTSRGSVAVVGDADLAHARLDRVFCGVDGTYTGHMLQLVANSLGIKDSAVAGNVAVAMMHAIGPQDPIEAILAAQMVAAHDAAMEMISRARNPEQPSVFVDACITRATRLMRTVTSQVMALKDYRSKGHQTVTVQHVDVRDGGQAVVGDIVLRPGGGGT